MKPQRLEFFGLFNFGTEQTIDFGALSESDCFYVVGERDGGKEVIADIFLYALFGKTEAAGPERFIINRKSKNAGIKLTFEHGGETYLIEREFGISAGNKFANVRGALYGIKNGQKYIAAEGGSADIRIEEILGSDASGYKKAVTLNAYTAVNLLGLSDDAQLKYFKNSLGIGNFDLAFKEKLSKRITELNVKKALLSGKKGISAAEKQRKLAEYTAARDEESRKLAELTKLKAEADDKSGKITEYIDLKEKLDRLNRDISGLEAEKQTYDELEERLKFAEEASRVLPALKEKQLLEAENASFEGRREELLLKIADADAGIGGTKSVLGDSDIQYGEFYSDFVLKRDKLKESLGGTSGKDLKKDLEEAIEKDRQELKELSEKRVGLIKKLEQADEECEELKKKINQLTIDPGLSFDMSKANSSEAALRRLLKEKAYLDDKASELDVKIDDAARRREIASASVLAIQDEINKLEREKSVFIGEGDVYALFTKEYQKYHNLAHSVGKVDTYNDNIRQINKKKQTNLEEIDFDTLELDRAEATRLNAEKNLYNVNAKMEVAQVEREKVANVNYYVGVSNSVRVGDFCPVCSNVLTVKQPKTPLPIVPVDMELNKLRGDRTKAEEILANTVAVIAGLNANILHLKRLNQDLERDESFYVDCINDILREEGFGSVQLLYEAFIRQKDKYDNLKKVYERASVIVDEIDGLKDELRSAETKVANADREVAIYSEQYHERKYALSLVDTEYARVLEQYAFHNSLSEYDTPEKILERLESMASEKLVFDKEYEKKREYKLELERLISDCDRLELVIISKARATENIGDAGAYSDFVVNALTDKYYGEVRETLDAEEKANNKYKEIEEYKSKLQEYEKQKQDAELELKGIESILDANVRAIEALDKGYIEKTDAVSGKSLDEIESLSMGYFLYQDSLYKLNEYRIRLSSLTDERDDLLKLFENSDAAAEDGSGIQAYNIEKEITETGNRVAVFEHEIERISAIEEETRSVDNPEELEAVEAGLSSAVALKDMLEAGAYADYVASLNAEAVAREADKDVFALTEGRLSLSFADGIRVKDKLYGDKYRTLNTLDEGERLIVGLSILSALSKLISKGGLELVFIDGLDFISPKYSPEVKKILKKLKESFAYVGVMRRESLENAANALNVVIGDGGSAIVRA